MEISPEGKTVAGERLGSGTLHRLAGGSIALPAYDRASLKPAIAHIGVGAFHRCHQAEYADDLLKQDAGPWSILGVNLRAPDLDSVLNAQDGLYCRELRENGAVDRRVIGSIAATRTVLEADYDPRRLTLKAALDACAGPHIRAITLTVTEKGYCHRPATGEVDWDNADLWHDLQQPHLPRSAPGFLLELIRRRLTANAAPPTIVCCDNVPDNGATMRNSVLELAAQVCPGEARTIADRTHFLNTMVDRIVPATQGADIERFAEDTGVRDYGLVVGEPFRMWVVENPNGAPIPPWERAGALIVDDVRPYEILKMRVVNGIQSNLCQLGVLAGLDYMSDVMRRPEFMEHARRTIEREVAPNLPAVPGIDAGDYIALTLRRLSNPDLKHRTLQISTDGSQKIRQRLLEPIRDAIRRGQPYDGLLFGVAGWIVYTGGKGWDGKPHPVLDPLAPQLAEAHLRGGDSARMLVENILAIEQVFGADLKANADFRDGLVRYVDGLRTKPVMEALAALPR